MEFNMTAEGVGVGIAALGTIGVTVRYVVRSELDRFKSIFTGEIQQWVNGSFMRSKEVGVRIEAIEADVSRLREDGCSHRAGHVA